MRDQYDIVHTVAVLAKIIEKTFKKTLFFDFDRVVLHQYCMTGFRDRKSRLKKGRSQLCQIDGVSVAIECREEEERAKCGFREAETGENRLFGA